VILVDAAVESGAELREGFTVSEYVFDNDRLVGIRGRGPMASKWKSARSNCRIQSIRKRE
jgi:flavin-dependent dehydrogenase